MIILGLLPHLVLMPIEEVVVVEVCFFPGCSTIFISSQLRFAEVVLKDAYATYGSFHDHVD